MLYIPYITSLAVLHIFFFIVGFCIGIIETTSMFMLRLLQGQSAGPWMTGCGLAFCTSGVIVPVVQIIFPNIKNSYIVYALMDMLVFLFMFISPDSKKDNCIRDKCNRIIEEEKPVHFRVDYLCALLFFFTAGAGESVTFYLETYVSDTEVINPNYAEYIYILFFAAVAIGSLIAAYFQQYISNKMLVPIHAWCLGLEFISLVMICFCLLIVA
jgi:hypothetical protein